MMKIQITAGIATCAEAVKTVATAMATSTPPEFCVPDSSGRITVTSEGIVNGVFSCPGNIDGLKQIYYDGEGSTELKELDFPDIEFIGQPRNRDGEVDVSLHVSNAPALEELNLPNLKNMGGGITITDNDAIQVLNCPGLKDLNYLYLARNGDLREVTFYDLESIGPAPVPVNIQNHTNLQQVDFVKVTDISGPPFKNACEDGGDLILLKNNVALSSVEFNSCPNVDPSRFNEGNKPNCYVRTGDLVNPDYEDKPCDGGAGPQPTPAPPTARPTKKPTPAPPTARPTKEPTPAPPTYKPTAAPTPVPPTASPTAEPTANPTVSPTAVPTAVPTHEPTASPTPVPTFAPSASPTLFPTEFDCCEPDSRGRITVTEECIRDGVMVFDPDYPLAPPGKPVKRDGVFQCLEDIPGLFQVWYNGEEENDRLRVLDFPAQTFIDQPKNRDGSIAKSLKVVKGPGVTHIYFPELEHMGGGILVSDTDDFQRMRFEALKDINHLEIAHNTDMRDVEGFLNLESIGPYPLPVDVYNNTAWHRLNLPKVTSITGRRGNACQDGGEMFRVLDNPDLASVEFNSCPYVEAKSQNGGNRADCWVRRGGFVGPYSQMPCNN